MLLNEYSSSYPSQEQKSSSSHSFPRPSDSGTGFPHTYSLLTPPQREKLGVAQSVCPIIHVLWHFLNWIVSTGHLSCPVHACLHCAILNTCRGLHTIVKKSNECVSQSNLQCIIWLLCVCVCVCVCVHICVHACIHMCVCVNKTKIAFQNINIICVPSTIC